MRGKLSTVLQGIGEVRITPADAGKTRRQSRKSVTARDHPRGCGENNAIHGKRLNVVGSPPRMRGKPMPEPASGAKTRITPADAGKTWSPSWPIAPCRDHPRGCGENPVLHDFRAVSAGSPPRMRGKQCDKLFEKPTYGITPADAGKTAPARAQTCQRWDHPRGCGENAVRR